jgi:Putative beta barrel porin-7 (BBP7)
MRTRWILFSLALFAHAGLAVAQTPQTPPNSSVAPPNGIVVPPSGVVVPPSGPQLPPSGPVALPGPSPATSGGPVDPYQPTVGGPTFYYGHDPFCNFWADPEYLLWSVKKADVPVPLVATNALNGPLQTSPPMILFGDNKIDYGTYSGGRLMLGTWFDPRDIFGVEIGGFLLEERKFHFSVASDPQDNPILGIPFFDATRGFENLAVISFPGLSTGRIDIESSSRLFGGEANARLNYVSGENLRVDVVTGFRYLGLDEDLMITTQNSPVPGKGIALGGVAFFGNAIITTIDHFVTRSDFYGGQIGTEIEYRCGPVFLNVAGKLGLGDTHETVIVTGVSNLSSGPSQVLKTFQGGILALPSNIGQVNDDSFTVVPEVDVKLGYQFNRNISAFVGYTFLYWSDVVRPADQINRVINGEQVPSFVQFGGALPTHPEPIPNLTRTDFWAQGVSFGMRLEF